MTRAAECGAKRPGLKVVNIGLRGFYDALVSQHVEAVQLEWTPPAPQSEAVKDLLADLL